MFFMFNIIYFMSLKDLVEFKSILIRVCIFLLSNILRALEGWRSATAKAPNAQILMFSLQGNVRQMYPNSTHAPPKAKEF